MPAAASARATGTTRVWRPLGYAGSAAGLAGLLLTAGLLLGRADLAALGVAPLLTVVAAWTGRPRAPVVLELLAARQLTADGGLGGAARVHAPPGVTAVRLRVTSPGTRGDEAVLQLRPGTDRKVALRCTSVRTGEHELFRLDAIGLGDGPMVASDATTAGPADVLVLPGHRALSEVPLPPRLQGLIGPHNTRRRGAGGELHDVNLFAPGDRLRRIDWRTSARRGIRDGRLTDLYVHRTQATADATVVLVVDSRDDIGPDVATWAGGDPPAASDATSLDIAREAAASLARGYLYQGDRVGLEDLGRRRRPVPPAGGRRHWERIVRRLALSVPQSSYGPRVRAPQLPSGALVVVISTFLDDETPAMAVQWRRNGHRVVAVDVLPPVRGASLSARMALSHRMVRIQREDRLAVLRRSGVDVVRWAEDGPPPSGGPAQLATLARYRHHRGPR